jgi:hypothetical protein
MSVYVGIDVHRKRSQVAVAGQGEQVLANRNVPNGAEPILKVIGGLPPGIPAAFEAAYGTSWLVELLENYGFAAHLVHPSRCTAIASARWKNDKGRRRDLGPVAAGGPAAGGVDRPARCPAVAGVAAPPGGAGAAADPAAQPDPLRRTRAPTPGKPAPFASLRDGLRPTRRRESPAEPAVFRRSGQPGSSRVAPLCL